MQTNQFKNQLTKRAKREEYAIQKIKNEWEINLNLFYFENLFA